MICRSSLHPRSSGKPAVHTNGRQLVPTDGNILHAGEVAERSENSQKNLLDARSWPGMVGPPRGYYNSRIPARMIRKLCALDDAGERTLEMAARRMGLPARAHHRRSGRIGRRSGQARGGSGAVSQPGPELLELTVEGLPPRQGRFKRGASLAYHCRVVSPDGLGTGMQIAAAASRGDHRTVGGASFDHSVDPLL